MSGWLYLVVFVPLGLAGGLGLGWLAWGRVNRGGGGAAEDASRAYREGIDRLLAGENEKAIAELTKVLEIHPDTVETYLTIGNLFRATGDAQRAIRVHKSVYVRDKLDARSRRQAIRALAHDYMAAGLADKAIEGFEYVIDGDPDDADAYLQLARLYEAAGRHADAFDALQRHGRLTGKPDPRGLARIKVAEGRAAMARKERGAAKRSFQKAIDVAPGSAEAHDALAEFYETEGKRDKAVAAWIAAVAAEPEGASLAWDEIGEAAFKGGSRDKLLVALEEAARKFDRHPAVLKVLARHRAGAGREQEAFELLDEAEAKAPDRLDVKAERADILARQGKVEEALRLWREIAAKLG